MSWVPSGCQIDTPQGPFDVSLTSDEVAQLCGEEPSQRNEVLLRHFVNCWFNLLADSPLGPKPYHVYRDFLRYLLSRPLLDTLKTLSSLADKLTRSVELYGDSIYTDSWIGEFIDTPVFKEYHNFHRSRDPLLMKYLLSFLLFGKKLKYEESRFNDVALRDWEKIESELGQLSLPHLTVVRLKKIVGCLLGEYDSASILLPKFGGGKIAERRIKGDIQKVRYFQMDPLLMAVLLRHHTDGDVVRLALNYQYGDLTPVSNASRNPARVKFVPKDITKSRTICMERNTTMFTQQAVLLRYRDAMDKGVMSRWVKLEDQSYNRGLSEYGSITGDIDTIDMSSASDRVPWALVKGMFPKDVLFDLALTRSSVVELPNGSFRKVYKFAPMGSALCFPVQCTIFLSMAILSAIIHSCEVCYLDELDGDAASRFVRFFVDTRIAKESGFIHPSSTLYQPFGIYGDDICIDGRLTQILITMLTSCGFAVNVSKSFTGASAFRESCGGYYLAGSDVTPIRFTTDGFTSRSDAKFASSALALINRAGEYWYFHLRRYSIQFLLWTDNDRKRPFLFTDIGDSRPFGIQSLNPVNDHLRYCGPYASDQPKGSHAKDWQRAEYECFTFMYEEAEKPTARDCYYEQYLYMRWWATRTDERVSYADQVISARHLVTAGSRLKLGWTPA